MDKQELIARLAAAGQDGEAAAPRLGRLDWLAAGLQVLIEEGIEAVRITRLAEALAVTRGSFYWHFKDRAELLDALVAFWRAKNTAAVEAAVAGAASLEEGILGLFDAWVDPERFDPRLDHAMRDWARRSEAMRAAVDAADRTRVEAIARLYRRFGYAKQPAFIRARVIYFAQIGYYALDLEEPFAERMGYLEDYYESFTGRRLNVKAAAAYREKHLGRGPRTAK